LRLSGESVQSVRPGIEVTMTREPVGVVGIITPWNFPIAIPAWKIAPALAYGNTVVFKPADLVPGCGWALADVLARAGLPKGVFNLVMGKGSVVGQALLDSPDVNAISFTGSVATGKRVAEASAKQMRKFQLEMGGKNPLVVLDDADLKIAVECAANGGYFQTGQRCTASSRLVVTAGIHDKFVDALTERIKGLVVDDALRDGTHIGPVVDQSQLDQDESYIKIGREEGAKLHWGGERLNRATPGFYLQPALFTDTQPGMRINREEIFGPVTSVIKVKNYDEALAVANDTVFGLSSGICTTSLKYASDFRRNSEAGMVMVNLPTAGVDYHVPFGGRKGSSYGPREQGRYAAEFYTSVKTAYTLP
jgi:aldehyde dehydrogenase (NAD+)